jgi:integrase
MLIITGEIRSIKDCNTGASFPSGSTSTSPVGSRRPTSEEARQFLESARRDNDPLYAACVLVLVLGLRKGELLGLNWDAVDLTRGELATVLQLQRVKRQLLHRETKTG